jgi:acyl-CoA thioesterase-1
VRNRLSKIVCALLLSSVAIAARAETVTIVALGDSLTQGYGLFQEDGFVPQLERWLTDQGEDVALVNAGVSGDTTAGGLARLEWTLTREVDALIVALGGNDLLRGLPPEASRANIEGILQIAQSHDLPVLLVGLSAPGNYGPDYKQEFDAMYPELAAQYGALHAESFLSGLEDLGDRDRAVQSYMQSDGIHPNADGVSLIVATLGPDVQALIRLVEEP